jgi:hypothetical protein
VYLDDFAVWARRVMGLQAPAADAGPP